jgi:biopolymer transport protein ExbB/TolQ
VKALLVLISLCIPLSATAGVYKWVDANGQTHFGDRPPAQAESSEVAVKAAPASTDASARERHQKMAEFLEQQQEEREARQAANAKAEEKAEKQAELCRKLRARLKFLASVSTFYNINDQGERVYVNEAENTRIREDFRQKVRNTCRNE